MASIRASTLAPALTVACIALLAPGAPAHQCTGDCLQEPRLECRHDPEGLVIKGCDVHVRAGWSGSFSENNWETCTARAPSHTIARGAGSRVLAKRRNAKIAWDGSSRSGATFAHREEVDTAYLFARAMADRKGDAPLAIAIGNDLASLRGRIDQADNAHDTFSLTVYAGGDGWPWDQHSSSITARLELYVECGAPVDLVDQLLDRYGLAQFAAGLDRKIVLTNGLSTAIEVHVSRDEAGIGCTAPQCEYEVYAVPAGHVGQSPAVELDMDHGLSACYFFGPSPVQPDPSRACVGYLGDVRTLDASATCKVPP